MIFDETKDLEAKVQSSNLNEELGMIQFVFSDKTGTLTQNVMEFKKFTAGTHSYGTSNPRISKKKLKNGITNVNFFDKNFDAHYSNPAHPNHVYIRKMVEMLGVCHTVVVEEKNGVSAYNASSPDELALVNGAKFFGFDFEGRDEDNNVVINDRGTRIKYKLLTVIEFTSTRKRMTCVVETPEGKIKVYIKGADSMIIPLLRTEQGGKKGQKNLRDTEINLEAYGKEGLRTLLFAEKDITPDFFANWS
mmetsp:Transcript_29400/g.28528  ORF Transcript_29400/g.28528 Transcript_29400/m.28528 type:complete len:248 (+) Transcript_29400:1324-2067(+)